MPNFIQYSASGDSPAIALEANGGPLSVRIPQGRPYWRKAAFKYSQDMFGVGLLHGLAAQQIAAGSIGYGQGIDTVTVSGEKPALEVGTPYIVGSAGML